MMKEIMKKLVEIVIEACERDGNHELAERLKKAYQREGFITPEKKVPKGGAKRLYLEEPKLEVASEITYEDYTLKGKPIKIKRVYVRETAPRARDIKSWLKKGLKARKILKYKLDDYSFKWIVWYI